MSKKNITIEQLAQMVKHGFDDARSELNVFRSEFSSFRKDAVEELDRMHADIRDLKIALGPLVRVVAAQDSEIQKLRTRVDRIERKVGLTS